MPELPEVEITVRGVSPSITNQIISSVVVRETRFRQKVRDDLASILVKQKVRNVFRRAKYIVIELDNGILVIHLGMSGSLRLFFPPDISDAQKHDHIDLLFKNGTLLRFRDPRRFGLFDWFYGAAENYPIFNELGVEPLTDEFCTTYLYKQLQNRKAPIKLSIMNAKIVVGVGNIYASEALFLAKINPLRVSGSLKKQECERLVVAIKQVLQKSIENGGSSLKDFIHTNGTLGYFQQQHHVYGRENEACHNCNHLISRVIIGQRSSFYCPNCQV